MATTLTFGTGSTLLGLETSSTSAYLTDNYHYHSAAAFPTVSYAGTFAPSITASVYLTGGSFLPGHGVVYMTDTGGGTVSNGSTTVTNGYSFSGSSIFLTFTGSSTQLVGFLQGLYVGDSSASNDKFTLNIGLQDNAGGSVGQYAEYYSSVVCFLRGTGIATDQGDVAVEDLRIGDLVRTLDGALKPVKFIGTQTFEAEFVAAAPSNRPVLIRKNALAEGMPARDLYVSAMHSLYIDDVLVPAVALLNGRSILRADIPGTVEYFHIELEGHHVILAEGLPAESFIDDDSRAIFDNAYEYEMLYGEGPTIQRLAPRIEEGHIVETIRRRIAARAGVEQAVRSAPGEILGHVERLDDGMLEGWVLDKANDTAPVELEVLVDGEIIGRSIANRYRTDLDHAGLAGGRCAFTMAMPAAAASLDQVQVRVVATGTALRNAVAATASV